MLTKEEALWADHMLSTETAGLRKRAVALRSQGGGIFPSRKPLRTLQRLVTGLQLNLSGHGSRSVTKK